MHTLIIYIYIYIHTHTHTHRGDILSITVISFENRINNPSSNLGQVAWLVFYGILTLVGYLMSNPVFIYDLQMNSL